MKTINEAQIDAQTNEFLRAFLEFGRTGSDESAMEVYRFLQENPDQLIDTRKLPELNKEEYPFFNCDEDEENKKVKKSKKKFYDL